MTPETPAAGPLASATAPYPARPTRTPARDTALPTRERGTPTLRLALPKGRMQAGVTRLLEEAGIDLRSSARTYRPSISLEGVECKLLKPQNIIEMLESGSRDLGFAGADWVAELGVDLVELFDTGLDPVSLVAAAPPSLLEDGDWPRRPLRIATEYGRLTRTWLDSRGIEARVLRSFGATEVFPPEDADAVVDNRSSGATLEANGLVVVDELMTSSTRLYANPRALEDPGLAARIEDFTLLLRSVLAARERVLVEVNVGPEDLGTLVEVLPSMRQPTVASLHEQSGFAVRAAVPRRDLPRLIPALKARGGSDIVVSTPTQITP